MEQIEENNEPEKVAESAIDRKIRKRQEADARKQLGKKRAPLEKKIAQLEKSIASCEEEEGTLVAKFNDELSGSDIQGINIALDKIGTEKEKCEGQWEELSMELEELLEEFGAQDVT